MVEQDTQEPVNGKKKKENQSANILAMILMYLIIGLAAGLLSSLLLGLPLIAIPVLGAGMLVIGYVQGAFVPSPGAPPKSVASRQAVKPVEEGDPHENMKAIHKKPKPSIDEQTNLSILPIPPTTPEKLPPVTYPRAPSPIPKLRDDLFLTEFMPKNPNDQPEKDTSEKHTGPRLG